MKIFKSNTGILLFILTVFFSCKKEQKPATIPSPEGFKIAILKGGNQTDTIGNFLKDPILIEASKDSKILNNASFLIETTGCDINSSSELQVSKGQVSYKWLLQGLNKNQTLKITLLDSLKIKSDSLTISATGIIPTHGWHRSSCTPSGNPIVMGLCKLSSGRLISTFNSAEYPSPYYSDDNGITWHPFKNFPSVPIASSLGKIIATSSDELYVIGRYSDGIYYSKDGGQSWVVKNGDKNNRRDFVDIAYTKSGKLIFTTANLGAFISYDKGSTSQHLNIPFDEVFSYPSEQINGDLYLVGSLGGLYKSTDNGNKWLQVTINESVQSLLITENGDMYAGGEIFGFTGIMKSTNNGSDWKAVYAINHYMGSFGITKITFQNGAYYFYNSAQSLIKTNNFNDFTTPFSSGLTPYPNYIINSLGNPVIGTSLKGLDNIYYYLP